MTKKERRAYAKYRIESARKTYKAAKILSENSLWNSAINRLYYSVFYAVNALLVLNEVKTKTHSSVKSQFSLYFIKTGKMNKKYGELLAKLFNYRQKGDYENTYDYTQETVETFFEPALEMIDEIEKEINTHL